ncbi:serine hydrolase [Chelativorans sp. ZYF759]|uniref:serine hydrolase domain-containing protein n=1 Tax=Chelativorans sp. ZYF759 TaxID=2692213 RepID=UPI00145F418A|nr:serine hydrolase domain-containing protein [Chelativorans sp. ZYF759]NMG39916.1 serine hydrolase [Chelativorans sp. ZYF759]
MGEIAALLDRAVAAQAAPFLVAQTVSAEATLHCHAAGVARPGVAAADDTVLRIFSQTKAIGALAAMILIERGKFGFDTPVGEILPAFDDLPVLEGFDGETPRLRKQRTVCTVAHLASHTSGLAYEYWNADTKRWMEITGHPTVFSGKLSALNYALVSDPGTQWHYGPGVDWLGRVVEAADGRRIDDFCRQEIFEPLAMGSTAFELDEKLHGRLADAVSRDGAGFRPSRSGPAPQPEFYGMGHALYSTTHDYGRFLRMVLRGGELDGNRILKPESVASLLAARSGGIAVSPLRSIAPRVSRDHDPFPGLALSHSFAWCRLDEDAPGRRRAGSQFWAGALNTHSWLDPQTGIAGLFMTQLAPFADETLMAAYEAYERAVYGGLGRD